MRVLQLVAGLGLGGIETWLDRLVHELDRDQVALDLNCSGDAAMDLEASVVAGGATVTRYRITPTHRELITGLSSLIVDRKYDLIHSHLGLTGGIPAVVAKRHGVPLISSYHNLGSTPATWTRKPGARQFRALYGAIGTRYAVRNSAAITGCSEAVLRRAAEKAPSETILRVLPLAAPAPAPLNAEQRQLLRAEIGLNTNDQAVLHVGRMSEAKNHAGLLRTFRLLADELATAKLVMVGTGPLHASICAQVADLNLQEQVTVLGARRDVSDLMQASDVLLFPSAFEGLGLVCIEAHAAGLPIVASDIEGIREAVGAHGSAAILHPLEDEGGMASSVLSLLTDRRRAHELAVAGRRHHEANYSVAGSAAQLVTLYRDVLDSTG